MDDLENPNKPLMKWVNKNFNRKNIRASDIIHYLTFYYSKEQSKNTLNGYLERFTRNKVQSEKIKKKNHNPFKNNVGYYIFIVIIGLIVSISFILLEHYLIKYIHLDNGLNFIIK